MGNKDITTNFKLYKNFRSPHSPDQLHHIAFKTTNYDAMVKFYTNLFGCEPMYYSEDIAFLAFDEEHHRIAIANTSPALKRIPFIAKLILSLKNWLNRNTPDIIGLDHVSYRMTPIEKWFEFYNNAKKRGLKPYWTINHGWISGMYYKDPDGNLVELFYEHWKNEEEFEKAVTDGGFPEEPVGTNMDIEILYKMYQEGADYETLIKKGNTVPEGKSPVSGIEAAVKMTKKYK